MRARVLAAAFFSLVLIAGGMLGLGCWAFSAPRYQGPRSDHFDGERFFLAGAPPQAGFKEFWRWQMNREHAPWPARFQAPPGPPPPARVGAGDMRITFINH